MTLEILSEANSEVMEAAVWFAIQHRYSACRLFWEFWREAQQKILESPRRYARAQDCSNRFEVRSYPFPKFGYRAIFQVLNDRVVILSVHRSQRRDGFWNDRIRKLNGDVS